MLVLTLQEQIDVLVEAKKIYKYGKITYDEVGKIRPLGICCAIVAAITKLHQRKISHEQIGTVISIYNNQMAKKYCNAKEKANWEYWWPVFITETNADWLTNSERFDTAYYKKQLRNAKPRLEFLDWCITRLTKRELEKREYEEHVRQIKTI